MRTLVAMATYSFNRLIMGKVERISVTLGIVRLIFGSPELHFKAPGTVKIQIGQKFDVL